MYFLYSALYMLLSFPYYQGGYIEVYCVYTQIKKLIEKCTPVVIATGSADYPTRAHNVHIVLRKYYAQYLQVAIP